MGHANMEKIVNSSMPNQFLPSCSANPVATVDITYFHYTVGYYVIIPESIALFDIFIGNPKNLVDMVWACGEALLVAQIVNHMENDSAALNFTISQNSKGSGDHIL